jgi:3-methyladenine DNA glycosylase AlkD
MTVEETLSILKDKGSEENRKGMSKYGINTTNAFGVNVQDIRELSKTIGKDHVLALELWKTKNHEARILATIISEPAAFTSELLDDWAEGINSWDLCDQFCNNLVYHTPFAMEKILIWSISDEPFIKRAGFATMANYALKHPDLREKDVDGFFGLILNECWDKRNYVRKAVSWALRNIGKRSLHYNRKAVKIAKQMKDEDLKPAQETATEAIKELQKSDLLAKLKAKQESGEE